MKELIAQLKEDDVEIYRIIIVYQVNPCGNSVPTDKRTLVFCVMNKETETLLGIKYPAKMFRMYREIK